MRLQIIVGARSWFEVPDEKIVRGLLFAVFIDVTPVIPPQRCWSLLTRDVVTRPNPSGAAD